MNWKSLWVPDAEKELFAILAPTNDTGRVENAALEIDRKLQTDPENAGESREPGRRVLHIAPLGVEYKIYTLTREVDGLRVWAYEST